MTAPRMTKQQKYDFADHMAGKVFNPKMDELTSTVKGFSKQVQDMIATPGEIEASKKLSKEMLIRGKSLRIEIRRSAPVYGMSGISHNFEVDFAESIPMPISRFGPVATQLSISTNDLTKKGSVEIPEWVKCDSLTFWRSKLVPALTAIHDCLGERNAFHSLLSARMNQVSSLKKLKELAPELHTAWLAYFGESADNLPALIFDDVLAVMNSKAA